MNLDKDNVCVLNYNLNAVTFKAGDREFYCKASRDGINPTVISLTLSDLRNAASTSEVFSDGWLFFDKDVEAEIYKELHIVNWEEILTNSEIEEILMVPTAEGIQRLIDINTSSCFERVRACLFKLQSEGAKIEHSVVNTVDRRFAELQQRIRKSEMKAVISEPPVNTEMEKVKAQNEALQEQMAQMQEMMAKLLANQTSAIPAKTEPISEEKTQNTTVKKAGRPSTKNATK